MTDLAPTSPSQVPTESLDRLLKLALTVTGAEFALAALADGTVAARSGVAPPDASETALVDLGLQRSVRRTASDLLGYYAAIPIPDARAGRIGVMVLAAGRRLATAEHLGPVLEQIAGLIGAELSRERAEIRDDRESLFAEIDHRVKNVLAAVQSVASQSARRAVSLDGFLKAFNGRLKAIASAQELLTATRWRGASIHDLATAALSTLAPGQTRWDGPNLFLTPRATNALALGLHELAVNAVRHGALASESGAVDVKWKATAEGGFELDWVESGGPKVSIPVHKGFGSMLLEGVTGRELGGEVVSDFRASGLRVRITGSDKALAEPSVPSPPPVRSFSAPQASPTARESLGSPLAGQMDKVRGMRLIIVEDAVLLAMELEAGLEEAGARIVGSAGLVEEAMTLVDLPMDAAVLDCNLNGASVLPVAQALADRGVPFLFATGYGENRGAPEGFDAPIVRKPYDVAQIAAALAELTGRS